MSTAVLALLAAVAAVIVAGLVATLGMICAGLWLARRNRLTNCGS